jgi:hypothetical protein
MEILEQEVVLGADGQTAWGLSNHQGWQYMETLVNPSCHPR